MAAGAGAPSASAIVATAGQYVGYPYATVGDDPSTGFSCIGFVHFVFAQNGVDVPEDLATAYGSAPRVDQTDLQPGDLVFFQNTVWAGISHVDIYVGGGKMIGSDNAQTGVEWDTLSDAYWQQHYLGATRPLSSPMGMPIDPSAPSATSATSATSTPTASPVDPPAMSATPVDPWGTPAPTASPVDPLTTPPPSVSSPTPSSGSSFSSTTGMTVTTLHDAPVYSNPSDAYNTYNTHDAYDTHHAHTEIDMVTPSTPLTVVRTQGQWVNVSYDGGNQYGWVRGADLNLQGATGSGSSSGSSSSASSGTNGAHHGANGPRRRDGTVEGVHDRRDTSVAGHEAIVTADILFVRNGPDPHARILRRVHAGDRLSILGTLHGWDHVSQRDGSHGWVSAQWVQATNAA